MTVVVPKLVFSIVVQYRIPLYFPPILRGGRVLFVTANITWFMIIYQILSQSVTA